LTIELSIWLSLSSITLSYYESTRALKRSKSVGFHIDWDGHALNQLVMLTFCRNSSRKPDFLGCFSFRFFSFRGFEGAAVAATSASEGSLSEWRAAAGGEGNTTGSAAPVEYEGNTIDDWAAAPGSEGNSSDWDIGCFATVDTVFVAHDDDKSFVSLDVSLSFMRDCLSSPGCLSSLGWKVATTDANDW